MILDISNHSNKSFANKLVDFRLYQWKSILSESETLPPVAKRGDIYVGLFSVLQILAPS